jgi:hypothetical protein
MSKKAEEKQLKKLLESYSIKEITTIFASIDEKIVSLHDSSAQDFLNFNSQLKKYYNDSKIISDNASKLFEHLTGKESRTIFNEFNTFHEKLKAQVDYFQKELEFTISSLTKILNNLNFLFIPLKNFGQNLMTLKYLLTSLKLNLTNMDLSAGFDAETQEIVGLIEQIKESSPQLDEDLFKLKEKIKQTLVKLENINKTNSQSVELLLKQIHSNISFLSTQHEEALIQIPKLSRKTEDCFNSISKIITSLQYQDIIRQKMEHIQKTYIELIKELNILDEDKSEQFVLFKQAKYVKQIPYIAELQIAQLIQTNKEYQNAIQDITNQFVEIGSFMSNISEMCEHFSGHKQSEGETHFKEIQAKLVNANEVIEKFVKTNQPIPTEISSIVDMVENISSRLTLIVELDNRLQNLTLSALLSTKSDKNPKDLSKVSQQLKLLASDLRLYMNKSQLLFDQIQVISKELSSNILFTGTRTLDSAALSENLNSIIKNIKEEDSKILTILEENGQLSQNVSGQLKTSIEKVKYYDYFERVIEEIIIELNQIYKKLQMNNIDIKDVAKADELKNIENLYTTKSERIVHGDIVGEEHEEDKDEIEFF